MVLQCQVITTPAAVTSPTAPAVTTTRVAVTRPATPAVGRVPGLREVRAARHTSRRAVPVAVRVPHLPPAVRVRAVTRNRPHQVHLRVVKVVPARLPSIRFVITTVRFRCQSVTLKCVKGHCRSHINETMII
jgi:hypothetical protein